MSIDKVKFYEAIREQGLFKKLSQKQVDSIDAILIYWETIGYTDIRWLSYMFATAYHETAFTMLPIEEYGKGKGRPYGKKLKHNGQPYILPDQIYYGRGYVQLTWYENYEMMGRLINVELLKQPELALSIDVAVAILFEGMTRGQSSFGDFTGKSVEQYFNTTTEDPLGARRIINGKDKAAEIAVYYWKFKKALV